MENVKGNSSFGGKQLFLPPKCPPFPSASQAYGSGPCVPTKSEANPRNEFKHHQRTSSESFLIEEQPFWLDDLLNEPESPIRKGAHRRSSSDSFSYMNVSDVAYNIDCLALKEQTYKSLMSQPSWHCKESITCKEDAPDAYYHMNTRNFRGEQSCGMKTTINIGMHQSHPSPDGVKVSPCCRGSSGSISESNAAIPTCIEKQEEDFSPPNQLGCSEGSNNKQSRPEADQKRVKQQFAQRSRVRKLQYIAQLERNVEVLQIEGNQASSEVQFLDQQNLILSLENKALRERLESLAEEQLLKHFQREILVREIARLQAFFQQKQEATPTHSRSMNNGDLEFRFGDLSLKH